MRWPWTRRQKPDLVEAKAALAESQRKLDAAHAAQPEVAQLVRQLRQIRERNNFAAMITAALREHR